MIEDLFTQPKKLEGVFADFTPVEKHGDIWLKRDDLFEVAGVNGGKVRTCYALALQAQSEGKTGLTTAGSRSSPQVNIVANIAKYLGMDCVAHTPMGELNEELLLAQEAGCQIIQHKAGYNSVIVSRCREYAKKYNYAEIPFGMECEEAIRQTSWQVQNIPSEIKRIIMPIGSGMSICGIRRGLLRYNICIPVLGVIVGAAPDKRFERYMPYVNSFDFPLHVQNAGIDYHHYVDANIDSVQLDPVYESKCAKFLQKGDLLWIVGIRQSVKNKQI